VVDPYRPSDDYREGYDEGYSSGFLVGFKRGQGEQPSKRGGNPHVLLRDKYGQVIQDRPRRKRKLSAWNKFVKANSKKPRFIYRNGKLNLKKMGVAFRKTPAGKKKK